MTTTAINTVTTTGAASTVDSLRRHLVGLKMPRALEILDHTVRQLERGELAPLEALDALLAEEYTGREGRRVKAALQMARLTTVKTLADFDFSFQPSLDRNRILALAQLEFIDRHEVLHLLGPPGTGKSHLMSTVATGKRPSPAESPVIASPRRQPRARQSRAGRAVLRSGLPRPACIAARSWRGSQ